jgi:hypothetical protein
MTHFLFIFSALLSSSAFATVKSETLQIPGIKNEAQLMQEAYGQEKEENIRPLSQRSEIFERSILDSYANVFELRKRRRVGVGLSTAGQLGTFGAQIELGFAPDDSAIVGIGGGPRYSAYLFSWKRIYSDNNLAPFTNFGLAHWSSRGSGSLQETEPGVLGRRYLSQNEKNAGKFAKVFMTPSLGLQYSFTEGAAVGWNFFTEVVFLMEVSSINPHVTGAVGASFFF